MIKYNNIRQLTINKQHRLGSHEEQPLLFSLVHLILCYALFLIKKIKEVEMKCKALLVLALLLVFMPIHADAQESLSKSSTWYAKALCDWFPEKVKIHGSAYYTTRIRCSNKDLTHFKAKAGKTNIGLETAFHIEGSLKLDSLLSGLKVLDGAQGKKYMLLLQGYLFSPEGKLLWSQQGFPKGNSWVSETGSTTKFHLINAYSGSLKGCTAAILAVGDPIFIDGTSETRVILGMKRFSFKDDNVSTGYDPAVSKKVRPSSKPKKPKKVAPATKVKYTNLKYVEKKLHGWKYTEVVTIPVAERKKIFYELVRYQDRTGDDVGAYKVITKRYGLPEKAVYAIVAEGVIKKWPMP